MIRTKSTYWLTLLAALAILASGCDLFFDLTEVPLQSTSTPDVGEDTNLDVGTDADVSGELDVISDVEDDTDPGSDADAEPDAEPDVIADEDTDTGPDPDVPVDPDFCPYDFGTFTSACDPVAEAGCPQNTHCSLGLSGGSIAVVCTGLASVGSLNEGEPCSAAVTTDNCRRGLYCLNWLNPDGRHVCSKFCFLSTGAGCGEEQFCTYHFDSLDDVGFCVDRCDPYDPDACPTGSICAPDHNYPLQKTCHPEFRCLKNGAPTDPVEYKSSCVLQTLHNNGCPTGQTCARIPEGQRCVQPCQDDEACAELGEDYRCGDAYGDYELRYCDVSED